MAINITLKCVIAVQIRVIRNLNAGFLLRTFNCTARKCNTDVESCRSVNLEGEMQDIQRRTIKKPSSELLLSMGPDEQERLLSLWDELVKFQNFGRPVPCELTDQQWKDALCRESSRQRRMFYSYLFRKQLRKTKKLENKALPKKIEYLNEHATEVQQECAGLHQSPLYRLPYMVIDQKYMTSMYNRWQYEAVCFGPSIVIDMDYDDHMFHRECANCAYQIMASYLNNRQRRHHFHLYLCNVRHEGVTFSHLLRYNPRFHSSECMITATSSSYLETFPREQIVYLTPHCEDELETYDPGSVYVIGGIVSTTQGQPLSFMKATREGLTMAKLPLDKYLRWGCASKSLTIDQVVNIMLDLKTTGNWKYALRHVPKRKVKQVEE